MLFCLKKKKDYIEDPQYLNHTYQNVTYKVISHNKSTITKPNTKHDHTDILNRQSYLMPCLLFYMLEYKTGNMLGKMPSILNNGLYASYC